MFDYLMKWPLPFQNKQRSGWSMISNKKNYSKNNSYIESKQHQPQKILQHNKTLQSCLYNYLHQQLRLRRKNKSCRNDNRQIWASNGKRKRRHIGRMGNKCLIEITVVLFWLHYLQIERITHQSDGVESNMRENS